MKSKLTMMVAMAAACAVIQLTAMPTEEETRKAEPVVKKMLAQERAALESSKKTRSEVAAAAMKLAGEADTDAAKLLLMKGAFTLYVKDGNHEKAVETMRALEAAILDMPPQSVTNMIEGALLGVSKKEERARLYKLLGETKADIPSYDDLPSHVESKAIAASVKERSSVASILKGMIKLPGRDCWISATEVTQGQWESVMGNNPSGHKGANLPVENVSRDDCDVFLEKLNQTEEVKSSQFEFRLPELEEWKYAAWAGSLGHGSRIKPGVAGDVLDMAWVEANSSNQTHAVATKAPNAFGFYDMLGNVWEWLSSAGGDAPSGCGSLKGCAFDQVADKCTWNQNWHIPKTQRHYGVGLRLAAHIRSRAIASGVGTSGSSDDGAEQRQATVDGYTWLYCVKNGEAMIVTTNGLCAVSPSLKGDVSIPSTLGGTKVTSIGNNAFRYCRGLTSVRIPENVTSIGDRAFEWCCKLESVAIPYSVRNIGEWAFSNCHALKSVTIPSNLERIGGGAFINCRELASVTIPAKVLSIGGAAFAYCSALRKINVDAGNQTFASIDGVLYTKDQSVLLAFPNALTSVRIPKGVTNIGGYAFEGCNGLTSVTIPKGVTTIENNAFKQCGGLASVVMPSGMKKIGDEAFFNCRSLRAITIPDGVCDIGASAFWGCGELTSLTLPQGLTKIGYHAFQGVGKLTSVTIPESVTSIGGGSVFSYCGGLTRINVAEGNQKYASVGGVLYTKDLTELVMCPNGLTAVTIPERVTNIGDGAFIGCSKLTSVMLPSSVKSIGAWAFEGCNGLTSVTIPESVTKIGREAFLYCGGLSSVTMRGERPKAPKNIFHRGCGKLKSIHVPANAKSWAGMKEWCGILLVFDGKVETDSSETARVATAKDMTGPYGIRMQPDPGCEKGAGYVLERLVKDYLPAAVRYYGDPFGGKSPSRVYTIVVKRNDGSDGRGHTGPSWGGRGDGISQFTIGLAKGSDKWDMDLTLVANKILTVCHDDVGFHLYVNDFIEGDVKGVDPVPEVKEMIRRGLAKDGDAKTDRRLGVWRKYAPMWSVFEELRERHPTFILDYCKLKNSRYAEGKLPQRLSFDQMADLLGEVTGENMVELFKKYGVGRRGSQKYPLPKISVAQTLQGCDFLLNKDFKKNAKYYLCLFSASWCGPCRAEMPRIAKTYAESLKDDPDIELIHFSRDHNDEKALAWAKEHDIKFPVVKPNVCNPLGLNTRGIPHLFIVKADGTLVEDGHPMKLFTDEKLRELKTANGSAEVRASATEKTEGAFSLNAAPGSVTKLDLGNVPPLQFVYCPAGKFSMGYKEQPALSKVKDVEITSPFWVSKTPIRADQLESLGLNSITNAKTGDAVITDASIVVQKLPSVLKERFGKMLPSGYVFRLPTEAEFEYLQKSETKDKDAPTNIWGVERLYSGGIIALLERAPAYGRGVDVVNQRRGGTAWTDLVKVNYENQPDKDPVGWSDDPNWSVFRRGLGRNCYKLITIQGGGNENGFYFVVAPDVDKLNKFYWK